MDKGRVAYKKMDHLRRSCAFFLLVLYATSGQANTMEELLELPLEDLVKLKITVSNRASETLQTSASAVTVITSKQIKNSGIRSIPELMRLVPGFHVKRIDGNKWAINSRRISNRFSNSMLVLMDGRTLYNPLFAGTFWDVQDMLIEDIDHIEVIRGPGSAAWGANAVTGVINIVTKSAADTQGGLAYAGAGRGEMAYEAGIRQGISLSEHGDIRFYGKGRETGEGSYRADSGSNNISTNSEYLNDPDADDGIKSTRTGFRYDLSHNDATHTLLGDWYQAEANDTRRSSDGLDLTPNTIDSKGYFLVYRMGKTLRNRARIEATAYYDYTQQLSDAFHDKREIANLESIYHQTIKHHVVSLGASYRYIADDTENQTDFGFALKPRTRYDEVMSVFVQDRWEVIEDVFWLTAGSRFEHNDYSGNEYNPSLRALLQLDREAAIWLAISRSVRTPSRTNADGCLGSTTTCFVAINSASSDSEVTYSYEVGYRQLLSPRLNIDVAIFEDREDDPLSDTSGEVTYHAKYRGAEVDVAYQPLKHWQLVGSVSYLDAHPDRRSSQDSGDAENWTTQFRSHYQLGDQVAWNFSLFFSEGQNDFSSETRIDTNLIWQVNTDLDLQFSLNNLTDDYHYEASDQTRLNSAVQRGAMILATLKF